MQNRRAASRPPIVLIVDDKEWSTRSLESVLEPGGYAVMRAYTGAQGFERVRTQVPDAVFVGSKLPDGDGVAFCRALREDPQFGAAVPIIITNPERPTREDRLSALQAGAWDLVSYPIDAQELKLRIESYMRARLESEQVRDRCLVDQLTGLYNLRGLERRDRELRSQAYREAQPLACVVMSLAPEGQEEATGEAESREAAVRLGKALQRAGRISDAIGRLGPTEFAILAPSTDLQGAVLLIERIAAAIDAMEAEADPGEPRLGFRAGYDAVENVRDKPVEARELMLHATMALRGTKTNGERIRAF
jgi:diguanylate cyclase (GGDEF)-like protein